MRQLQQQEDLRNQTRAFWATLVSFAFGASTALVLFWGTSRPFGGTPSLMLPIAVLAACTAIVAFGVSTAMHHRGETLPMPSWQKAISHVTTAAVTLAYGGVTALSVLLVGQLVGPSLPGLEFAAPGSAILSGLACALAGRFAFHSGIDVNTQDLAALLFTFLVVGTVFAMLNEADGTWWERNFSQLGIGTSGWAFNFTLIIAGLLITTIGSYIGRDLHRVLKDRALQQVTITVLLWGAAGVALTLVGVFPLDQQPIAHLIAAFAALVLLVAAAGYSQHVLPGAPFVLRAVTTMLVILIVLSVVITFAVPVLTATALEGIVVGLSLLWMTTFVQVLGVLSPQRSVPSQRRRLIGRLPSRVI